MLTYTRLWLTRLILSEYLIYLLYTINSKIITGSAFYNLYVFDSNVIIVTYTISVRSS